MLPALALLLGLLFALWLQRFLLPPSEERSVASWLPTLWLGILASRPVSYWFGAGGEGSSVNLIVLFGLMLAGVSVLIRRRVNLSDIVWRNKAVFAFYLFFALSATWSWDPALTLKRIVKDFGCVILALVVLTDANPGECIRTVYLRCACWLIPLSVVLCKYYPQYGRGYAPAGGQMYTGVTTQKNSLGETTMLLSLFVVWKLVERRSEGAVIAQRSHRVGLLVIFLIAAWLLYASESKTSQVSFLVGLGVLFASRSRMFRHRVALLTMLALALPIAGVIFIMASQIAAPMVEMLGRDTTFTGRTAIWGVVKAANINPLTGEGFCIFWDARGSELMTEEVGASVGSAHSGYWEVFIDGGILGLGFLGLLIAKALGTAYAQMTYRSVLAGVGLMVLVVVLMLNLSESYFARFSASWYTFLLFSMAHPSLLGTSRPVENEVPCEGDHGITGKREGWVLTV